MKTIAIHLRLKTASHRKQHAEAVAANANHGNRLRDFAKLQALSDADADTLLGLARLLTPDAEFNLAALRNAMANGKTELFVIRRRGKIVAAATAVRFVTPTGRHCHIEDVVVDENSRGKGLGKRIMTEMLRSLKAEGVTDVALTSRPSRVAANALYQSIGFSRRKTNVYTLKL